MEPDAKPLDVWLKFAPELIDLEDDDPLASHEANTFKDGDVYRVDWYLNAVGLVTSEWFTTYGDAQAWLEREGFEDYSS